MKKVNMPTTIIAILLLLSFVVITVVNSQPKITDDKNALFNIDREFSKFSEENGIFKAFTSYMDNEAVIYRDKQEPFKGREAITELFKNSATTSQLIWEPTFADIDTNGNLGYTRGKWTYTATDSNNVISEATGYYVTIWKKQTDGSWKYVFDTGISSPEK